MSLTNGPNLGLIENGLFGEQHYAELMRLWRGLDALVQPTVKSATTATPPTSPRNGDCYLIPIASTGAWKGRAGQLARWSTMLAVVAGWEFFTARAGWSVRVVDQPDASGWPTLYIHSGKVWIRSFTPMAVKAGASLSVAQALPAATFTKVALDTVEIDTDKCFSMEEHRLTPKMAGWYQVTFLVTVNKDGVPDPVIGMAYKNGIAAIAGNRNDAAIGSAGSCSAKLQHFNGSTDYCELFAYCGNASGEIVADPIYTFMSVVGPM
ncbi:DUF2793 domain-containing protein [Glaciimonas immobilis]|uniref:DUF2793 domain-containing protein n=1 Tax=Glaciimonas immobilis TaxID=728004 RepID=A0A840RLH9_9BURK|nr:DUF2793 domain-containing protein [Glaciimonas immobilis]KAF3999073.1 DUF2793 domain-containing protein [Glaciimonas immobilis]MBB5198505.1 hypothetical protein [Glaciimonas immobilis]